MKILCTATYYLPHISGLTLYAARTIRIFEQNGHKVTFLTTQHIKKLPIKEKIGKTDVIRIPYQLKISKGFIMFTYPYVVFKEVLSSDIILMHLPQVESIFTVLISVFLRKKVYCVYHCDLILSKGILNKIIEKIVFLANYITLIFAQKVITNTKDYADHSVILSYFLKKIVYMYPPVSLGTQSKISIKIKKIIPENKILIGFVGRFAKEKGLEYLLEAIPYLKRSLGNHFAIVLAGQKTVIGEEKYLQKISPLIKRYKDYVIFIESPSEEEVHELYAILTVLVLPSIDSTESFGMVQIEAMLRGVPVVSSNLPGIRIPVRKTGMGLLVSPNDAQELANAISRIVLNRKFFLKKQGVIKREFVDKTILFWNTIFLPA